MTPNEAAAAVRWCDASIEQCRTWQASVDDVLLLVRIGVQLAALRAEQRYLIGLITRDPVR